MIVGVAICELHLPGVRDLKGKRKIVKSLVERLHRRHRISVAETAFHDLHQRAQISMAAVGNSESEIELLLDHLRDACESESEALVSDWRSRLFAESD